MTWMKYLKYITYKYDLMHVIYNSYLKIMILKFFLISYQHNQVR